MARGPAARRGSGGGERIQKARTLRVGLGAGSLTLAAALAAYPVASSAGLERLVAVGAVAGLLSLGAAALGAVSALPWGLALLGGEYAAWFALRGGSGIDTRAPVYAAGFLAVAELAYWAQDRRTPAATAGGLDLRRFFGVLAGAVGAVASGALVLAISTARLGGGVALEALGVVCAVALLGLLARLVRADRDEPPPL